MPSKPCEKFPGSNSIVVVDGRWCPENSASRHECPKCVNCMLTIVRSVGSAGGRSSASDAGGTADRLCAAARAAADGCVRDPADMPARRAIGSRTSAWLGPRSLPLDATYHWPGLAGWPSPRRRRGSGSRNSVRTPPVADDPRAYAVAARAVVGQPDGQWQLQAQIVHWRGETWRGGQLGRRGVRHRRRRACAPVRSTAPLTRPSITTDEPNRMAAVISGAGQVAAPVSAGRPAQQHHQSNWRCGTIRQRPPAVGGRRCPTRRSSTRWRRRCARAYLGSCPVELHRRISGNQHEQEEPPWHGWLCT